MLTTRDHIIARPFSSIDDFPFDVIDMRGDESADFLQRISTNDFSAFVPGAIQKTLFVTDKGRIIDAVWVMHRMDHLLIAVSRGMASEIVTWLNKYIVMEEIGLTDVSSEYEIALHFDQNNNFFHTDYFGFPASFEIKRSSSSHHAAPSASFEEWRIRNGIPMTGKEIVSDYNPLELNLWDWINFSKGCYIGQEVVARLDTYNKIQRSLCRISSAATIHERDTVSDDDGSDCGKITSIVNIGGSYSGLAVIRMKCAAVQKQLRVQGSDTTIEIENVFTKELHGRD